MVIYGDYSGRGVHSNMAEHDVMIAHPYKVEPRSTCNLMGHFMVFRF